MCVCVCVCVVCVCVVCMCVCVCVAQVKGWGARQVHTPVRQGAARSRHQLEPRRECPQVISLTLATLVLLWDMSHYMKVQRVTQLALI
jgi:hypothetical protein